MRYRRKGKPYVGEAGNADSGVFAVTRRPPAQTGARADRSKRNGGEQFCALPERVMGDKRLPAVDFQVLAAIAYYDRFGSSPKVGDLFQRGTA